MNNLKVLHILFPEKFFKDYISFVNQNFTPNNHLFLYLKTNGSEPKGENVRKIKFYRIPFLFQINLYRYFKAYDIIFLHSLSKSKVIFFLFLFPKFLKKTYWLLWGGDLYYKLNKFTNKKKRTLENQIFSFIVKRLGYVLTHVKGDVDLISSEFGFKGKHYECFLYPSNIVKSHYEIKPSEQKDSLNILLGNSAHESNRHIEALKILSKFSDINFNVYCPLSYGDKKYAKKVILEGKRLFGDGFIPLTEFMPLNEYNKLLNKIDIAIFNNWRQQAMGNIITLLAMGKTVYIRKEVTTWEMLKDKGFVLKDFSCIENLEVICYDDRVRNSELAREYFSYNNLKSQYINIFNNHKVEY